MKLTYLAFRSSYLQFSLCKHDIKYTVLCVVLAFYCFYLFLNFIFFPFSIMLFPEWKAGNGMARTGMFHVRANPKEKVKQN